MSSNDLRQARGLLAFARFVASLKRVPRTGWLDRGVPDTQVESVADHSLVVAFLAWACAIEAQRQGTDLDPARVALLAMIHDLPEAETGDTPPYDRSKIPPSTDIEDRQSFLNRRHLRDEERRSEKRRAEDAAMRRLVATLPEEAQYALRSMWDELRLGESAEARFVKQVDRLETFLQSRIYLEQYPDAPMDSFQLEVQEAIDDPVLIAIRDEALSDQE